MGPVTEARRTRCSDWPGRGHVAISSAKRNPGTEGREDIASEGKSRCCYQKGGDVDARQVKTRGANWTHAQMRKLRKNSRHFSWIGLRRCGIYYILSHKKEWNITFCRNMDGHRDYHTQWSKSYRKTQISYNAYMWTLKNNTGESI